MVKSHRGNVKIQTVKELNPPRHRKLDYVSIPASYASTCTDEDLVLSWCQFEVLGQNSMEVDGQPVYWSNLLTACRYPALPINIDSVKRKIFCKIELTIS